ncbi:DUF4169 family protein [Maritimibacter fusiformis]|uniref:DUF4169 family protein n=1 Tax=Maritimibacter fusiformis TaxID=2603819 RepID=A0A5D0RIX0_9RHOB|nr:DUF4169 family protein [Maritimibacter fusiformis]TYB81412.1 DUF4169 family protein [Maritimibacter fusiformis]
MAKVASLSKARKTRARDEKRAAADANAVKYGRTGAEKAADKARAYKAARDLDGKKRE